MGLFDKFKDYMFLSKMPKTYDDSFYKNNIKKYLDLKIVRELFRGHLFSIISVGERVYSVCPYVLSENEYTIGIYLSKEAIKKLMKNEKEIYSVINVIFNNMEKHKKLLLIFTEDKIDSWQNWVKENENIKKIDYEFEDWLIKKYKKR